MCRASVVTEETDVRWMKGFLAAWVLLLWSGGGGGGPAPNEGLIPGGAPVGPGLPTRVGEAALVDGIAMVRVPSGTFSMGLEKGPGDQRPPRTVYTNRFYLDRTEVTNAAYHRFWTARDGGDRAHHTPASHGSKDGIGDWPERAGSQPDRPVVGVTWFDAVAYCKWRGGRLPTEAEWEKAARGDESREPYPWNKGLDGSRANYRDGNDGYDNTLAPVGSYPEGVSFYGAMDLVGNVWEWCADYYEPDAYKVAGTVNPTGPETGVYRVLRGGSWRTSANEVPNRLSITYRSWSDPQSATDGWGFRCVRDIR